jgi:mRNA-degrading endonuclease toxin of MazEF toxin-antitoxin module
VVPLSSSPEAAPPVVVSIPGAGRHSVAVLDQIRAVDKKRFVNRAGILADAGLRNLEAAPKEVLQLPSIQPRRHAVLTPGAQGHSFVP